MNNYFKHILILVFFISFCTNAEVRWEQKANFRGPGRHRGTGFSIGDKGYMGLGHVNSVVNIPYADIWEYDPATDTWSQKADYPSGGNYGASAFTIGNKAYVGNGVYSYGDFFAFDPITNTWDSIAPCPYTFSEKTAFTLDEKGYYVGDSLYEYDPALDKWQGVIESPTTFGSWITSFATDGKGYVLGGGNLYEYKKSTNTWSQRAPIPNGITGGSAAFSINNKGYVVAGYSDFLSGITNATWEFNPGSNQWREVMQLPGASRRFHVGFAIDNFGYIGLGTNGVNFNDFYQLGEEESFNDFDEDIEFSIFPNPAVDYISINLDTKIQNSELLIYTLDGSLVLSEKLVFKSHKIDVLDLKKGVYIYKLMKEDKLIKEGQFVKN